MSSHELQDPRHVDCSNNKQRGCEREVTKIKGPPTLSQTISNNMTTCQLYSMKPSLPFFPSYNKKERTTYVAGGSSYSSFPVKQQDDNVKKQPVSQPPPQQKPFRCNECGQTFSRSHNLKSHSATHSLVRPYKCETCSREFRRLHDLKRHQKLHTGERPYVCTTCDRSFSRLDALNRHMKAEIGCDRSKRSAKDSSEPRRSSAPTLPSFHEHQNMLPPIMFASFDTLRDRPQDASDQETDLLRRQIHDLQVENRVLRSLVMDTGSNQQQRRLSAEQMIITSSPPSLHDQMDWRKSL